MAHQHLKNAYHRLVERINRFPQGAPPSELLYGILRMLFSEKEAELVSLLPIRPFDARKAAAAWNMDWGVLSFMSFSYSRSSNNREACSSSAKRSRAARSHHLTVLMGFSNRLAISTSLISRK